jgi:AcrR family transcriptional regulator
MPICAIQFAMNKSTRTTAAAKPSRSAKSPRLKRARGRPRAAQGAVGREAIVKAACDLLEKLPPHKVTMVDIARAAGVDPALLRYYFADREELLLAVIELILETWIAAHPVRGASPPENIAKQIGYILEFSSRYRSMQRLMIDECAQAKSAEVRRRVVEMNAVAIHHYARLLGLGAKAEAKSLEPLFMHVAIIGMCEFFLAAQPWVRPIAPAELSTAQLTERYREFITGLVLDGLRSHVEP